jgi:CubicO group peptidase (beta-lactamase class C family)
MANGTTIARATLPRLHGPAAFVCLLLLAECWTASPACGQTDDEVAIDLHGEFYTDNPTYTDSQVYTWPTGTPASQGLNGSLLASGSQTLANTSKSASFLVVRGDRLVYESYFHGATAASAKNIHSASKSILSALTGIAIDEGLLSLDTKIGDVLPQYSMSAGKKNITVQNLLTMKSGLNWYEDDTEYDLQDNFVQEILDLQLRYTPGTHYNYSTGDAHLLGAVLANATGESLFQFGKSRLFDPLGIDVDRWGRDDQGYFSGGANFYITPREMAAFGQLYLDDGRGIVPEDWIAESTESQTSPSYYGYMWWLDVNLNGYEGYRAWGWGKNFIYVFPSLDMTVVITHDTDGNGVKDTDLNNFVRDYVINAVVGSAAPLLEGDYNGDLVVDEMDFGLWRQTFGKSVSPWGSGADGNQNGIIDAADYAIWRDHLGNSSPGGASFSAIPEPPTGMLAMWLVAVLVGRTSGISRRRVSLA